jgi:hypothetical protein
MGSACEDAVLLVDCLKRRTRTSCCPRGIPLLKIPRWASIFRREGCECENSADLDTC